MVVRVCKNRGFGIAVIERGLLRVDLQRGQSQSLNERQSRINWTLVGEKFGLNSEVVGRWSSDTLVEITVLRPTDASELSFMPVSELGSYHHNEISRGHARGFEEGETATAVRTPCGVGVFEQNERGAMRWQVTRRWALKPGGGFGTTQVR